MQLTNFFFRGLKAFSLVAIAAVLGGSPVAYSQAGAGKGKLAAIIEAASKEKEVVFQAPDPETGLPAADFLRDMAAITERLYGIKVNIRIDNSLNFPASVAKAITEIRSGAAPSYDLMFQNAVSGLPLYVNKAYEQIPWLELFPQLTPQDLAWNGITPIVDTQFILPIYNTRLVRPQDVPKSWDDLLNPRWKGKLGVLVNYEPWALLSQPNAWGEAKTMAFLKRLLEQSPKLGRLPESHERVLSGETPIASFGQRERTLYYKEQRSAPMGVVESADPALVYVYIFVVPKGAKNKNAAMLVAAAMMSKEGQELHQKYRNSTSMFRPGTPAAAFAKTHKVIVPDLDFITSKDYAELTKRISSILAQR
jgi:iron(III) transport system substrate-binding protein